MTKRIKNEKITEIIMDLVDALHGITAPNLDEAPADLLEFAEFELQCARAEIDRLEEESKENGDRALFGACRTARAYADTLEKAMVSMTAIGSLNACMG